MCTGAHRGQRGHRISWSWSYWWLWYWELSPGPLQAQSVLPTAESCLQPWCLILRFLISSIILCISFQVFHSLLFLSSLEMGIIDMERKKDLPGDTSWVPSSCRPPIACLPQIRLHPTDKIHGVTWEPFPLADPNTFILHLLKDYRVLRFCSVNSRCSGLRM